MTTPPSRSLTDWAVLGLVVERPRHGFAVARELGPTGVLGRIWSVRRPLVYRAVDHLVSVGLLEPVRTEPGAQGPERTVLKATRRGRTEFSRWRDLPVEHFRDVRSELLVKFAFLTRAGRRCTPLASRQLAVLAPLADGLAAAIAQAVIPIDQIVADYRLETSHAIRRMLEHVIAREAEAAAGTLRVQEDRVQDDRVRRGLT